MSTASRSSRTTDEKVEVNGKDKRRTSAPTPAPMSTANAEKFYEMEDRMALLLPTEAIRQRATELIENIRSAIRTQPPDIKTAKLLTLKLRQLNRLSNFRNRSLKEATRSAQAEGDLIYLSYNNLKNEISHLHKSIASCLDFRSADVDLELVSDAEFEANAEAMGVELNDEVRADPHLLRLAQLKFELAQRNRMAELLSEQDNRRTLLVSDIEGKENRLAQIKPQLSTVRDSAKPLLELLGLKKAVETSAEARNNSRSTPTELTPPHANGNIDVELEPDEALVYGPTVDPNVMQVDGPS